MIRVRFAPSPTGHLHIGGLRAALFNWLFARNTNGKFLIRIEDTDIERSKPEYTASILESFSWVGIASDEAIVIQTENKPDHMLVAARMLKSGTAYKCYCTQEEVQTRLGTNAAEGAGYVMYDKKCRPANNGPLSSSEIETSERPYVIRFKIPDTQHEVSFNDLIRGPITFPIDQFDDFIIVRSDGSPMYNFVVVVDDAMMRISHVIRGEDHISNTPKQILLYEACGFALPQFAHLPMILGPDGHRLSKRDAATSVLEYKYMGYVAEALCNYLVRLGWSHGDQEIFTREELITHFSLDHVGKKGAIFDQKKLDWVNSVYMKQLSAQELIARLVRDCDVTFRERVHGWSDTQVQGLVDLYKERVTTLVALRDVLVPLYEGPIVYTQLDGDSAQRAQYMRQAHDRLLQLDDTSAMAIEQEIKKMCTELAIALPLIAQPLRVALTGGIQAPGIFKLIAILGIQESCNRIMKYVKGEVHG